MKRLRHIGRIFCVAFMLVMIAVSAFAVEPNGLQKRELALLLEDLNRAFAKKDSAVLADVLADALPPRLYQEMAKLMQTNAETLRLSFKNQFQQHFAQYEIGEGSGYVFDMHDIDYHQASDGTFYALITARMETQHEISHLKTLALYENTKWYVIHGGQKTIQNSIFLEIYPFLEDVSIPLPEREKK